MRSFIRTIIIWSLSLSLTGLPVAALSQDIIDLTHVEKDMVMKMSGDSAGNISCHSRTIKAGNKVAQQVQHKIPVQNTVAESSMDGGCCGTDCQCQCDMNCPSVHHSAASAILQPVLFVYSPVNSQRIIESAIAYISCDSDVEITPPIA